MATYYIDYTSTDDSANGTSKTTPWKRCPGMVGFAGTYVHASGDRFIFKGGVTWGNAALGLEITNSGTDEDTRDYYGVDKTWFTGGSWSQPVFDAEGAALSNDAAVRGSVIQVDGASHVEIDNIEITGHVCANSTAYYHCAILPFGCDDLYVRNVYAHDWVVESVDGGKFGGFYQFESTNLVYDAVDVVGPSYIDPLYVVNAGWNSSGGGFVGGALCVDCTTSRTSQGFFNVQTVRRCTVIDGGQNYNDEDHENAINVYGVEGVEMLVDSCVVRSWSSGVCIFAVPAWGGANGTVTIRNTITLDGVAVTPINIKNSGNDGGATRVNIWNCTLDAGTTQPVRISDESSQPELETLDSRNNLFVTDYVGDWYYYDNEDVLPVTIVDENNHMMTQAEATTANLTTANLFKPSSSIAAIADQGTDLSSEFTDDFDGLTRVAPWDIGAYEYDGIPSIPNPPEDLTLTAL